MTYRVSTIVTYIKPSLPGIAQLSPSDQPAPPVCGAFFFYGHARGKAAKRPAPRYNVFASNADAWSAIAVPAVAPENILEQVEQRRRQGVGEFRNDLAGAIIGIDGRESQNQKHDPGPDRLAPLRVTALLLG